MGDVFLMRRDLFEHGREEEDDGVILCEGEIDGGRDRAQMVEGDISRATCWILFLDPRAWLLSCLIYPLRFPFQISPRLQRHTVLDSLSEPDGRYVCNYKVSLRFPLSLSAPINPHIPMLSGFPWSYSSKFNFFL